MLNKFLDHIKRKNLCNEDAKVLLAISGGIDSMVMLDLFKRSKIKFAVAHFNHVTRSGASDSDESFVKGYCDQAGIPFFSMRQDVKKAYPSDNFQDRARKLRYQFFNQVCQSEACNLIATAHHLDDQLESFLINYSRGAGLDGLSGIKAQVSNLIRPLMFCGSDEIRAYQESFNIPFVVDASNDSDDYLRNRIRHHIIPPIKKEFPSILKKVNSNHQNLNSSQALLLHFIDNWKLNHLETLDHEILVNKAAIAALPSSLTLVHYLFSEYGFKRDQLKQLIHAMDEVGANFYSQTHRILVDRVNLIVTPIVDQEIINQEINLGLNAIGTHELKLELVNDKSLSSSKLIELVDLDKLVFPLRIRYWQPGDRYAPIGMPGQTQKVKNLLINQKIPQHEKENVLVLLSAEKIIWVVGHRLDSRFKIDSESKQYLRLTYGLNDRS